MSGTVKKIFMVLIIMVACVMIGALVLNVLMPNAATSVVDGLEQMIYNATGMKFDWNGNGSALTAGGSVDITGGDMRADEANTNAKDGDQQVAGLAG